MQDRTGCESTTNGSARNCSVQIATAAGVNLIPASCQGIETGTKVVMSDAIRPEDLTPPGNSGKRPGGDSGKYQEGIDKCRHHRVLVMREVPLYMVAAAIRRGIRENGGKTYRVVVVRTHWHHYNIKIRCSTKRAIGLRSPGRPDDQTLAAFEAGERKTGDGIEGGCGMNVGRPTKDGIEDAVPIAKSRGTLLFYVQAGDCPADFEITSTGRVAIIRVKRTRRLHCTVQEIEDAFSEPVRRLRMIPGPPDFCRELWLWSPYGTFRFFRVCNTGIAEIDRNGDLLVDPVPGTGTDRQPAAGETAG